MKRWMENTLAAVSLGLFLVAAVACVRSQFALDGWFWSRPILTASSAAGDGTPMWRVAGAAASVWVARDGLVLFHWRVAWWGNWPADRPGPILRQFEWIRGLNPAPHNELSDSGANTWRIVWHRSWWARVGPEWVRMPRLSGEATTQPIPQSMEDHYRDPNAAPKVIRGHRDDCDGLWIPHWCLLGFTGILPALWLRRWRRERRRARAGCCRRCGYDLRGNPAAAACPECGTPVGR